MLHRIRKMIGVAVTIMRNCASESLIKTALQKLYCQVQLQNLLFKMILFIWRYRLLPSRLWLSAGCKYNPWFEYLTSLLINMHNILAVLMKNLYSKLALMEIAMSSPSILNVAFY